MKPLVFIFVAFCLAGCMTAQQETVAASASAESVEAGSKEQVVAKSVVKTVLLHCLPGIMTDKQNNHQNLIKAPPNVAAPLLRGADGTVWQVPGGGVILVDFHPERRCSTLGRGLDAATLRTELDLWFSGPKVPFEQIRSGQSGQPPRELVVYQARHSSGIGSVTVVAQYQQDVSTGTNPQAVVTVARTQDG